MKYFFKVALYVVLGLHPALLFAFNTIAENKTMKTEKDVHSFANTDEVIVTHLALDLKINFEKKEIGGKVTLTVNNKTKARTLIVDTRDLVIQRATLDEKELLTTFTLGAADKFLGQPLSIAILPETKIVTIYYNTKPNAAALQWLEPSQTAGKQKPFLFTQSEAILARTWVPCQDGPGVRITYNAKISVPSDLMAVMSAKNEVKKNVNGVYVFEMNQPVPSYLLALAVGDLEFRPIGNRAGVFAEPSVVDKAAWEFADVEKMISSAEELYGPYRWERYDIIVLPPSFPFGGMENPRLTFATPTILAGDRSLVALIAHELAHSWSGNLVTNATWNDFWLNEGFTVYVELRIMEKVYGRNYSEMLAQLAYKDLLSTLHDLGKKNDDTKLFLNLVNRNPDDGMTDIAYNKGYFFLRLCEETFGREQWDTFLKSYFNEHSFQSMTTEKFLAYLRTHLMKGNISFKEKLQIEAWVYGVGLPNNCPKVNATEFEKVTAQANLFLHGTSASKLETKNWTTHHWLHFMHELPDTLSQQQMIALDYTFNFSRTGNSEIACEWFQKAIAAKYETAYGPMEKFLMNVGRRKFLKPLYTKLAKSPDGKAWAKNVYAKARPGYHSVAYNTIDEILK